MNEIIFFPNDETFISVSLEKRKCISCRKEKTCIVVGEPPAERFCGLQLYENCISDIFKKE